MGSLAAAMGGLDAIAKTIDNDLQATVVTFGFDSAVAFATSGSGHF